MIFEVPPGTGTVDIECIAWPWEGTMLNRRRFDWIVDPALPPTGFSWDVPVKQSEQFVVLPSKGSLVAGWLLIVPRRPILNLSCLSDDEKEELEVLCANFRRFLSAFEGRVFEFEHGARQQGTVIGCGVDQAHLHLVPLPFDLTASATCEEGVEWFAARTFDDPWRDTRPHSDYLLVRESNRSAMVGYPRTSTSQWFRRLIAKELEIQDQWNYREYPFRENVDRTLEVLKAS